MKDKIYKALVATGFSVAVALSGAYLTAPSEAPNAKPILVDYLDTGGVPTACLGSTGTHVKKGTKRTEDECVKLFVEDFDKHHKQLISVFPGPFRSDWQEGALTDFVFNKGIGNFKSSTLLVKLKAGKHNEACDQLTRWIYGKNRQGVKIALGGLKVRATAEYQWCMGTPPKEVLDIYNKDIGANK